MAEELQRYPCFYEKGNRVYKERDRSSRPEVFFKKVVLRNFTKFKGKHLCQVLFFNKVEGLRSATLIKKKRLGHGRFSANFVKFLRTPFLKNTSGGCFRRDRKENAWEAVEQFLIVFLQII